LKQALIGSQKCISGNLLDASGASSQTMLFPLPTTVRGKAIGKAKECGKLKRGEKQ
jgi:hypothetical protein